MKRFALILAALAACGGEPPTDLGVAKEPIFMAHEGVFVAIGTGSPFAWIQQVPIATSVFEGLDQSIGTRFNFSSAESFNLFDGSTHDSSSGATADDFRLSVNTSNDSNSNNISCPSLSLGGVLTTKSFITGFFATALQPNPLPTAAFYAGQIGESANTPFCSAVNGQWSHPIRRIYVLYENPFDSGKPRPSPSPHGGGYKPQKIVVRIDIDFPESGVTNRYWFNTSRTQGT